MSNPADPLVGRVLAERFEILERIGEGGTGVVYKAKQLSVDRTIAIKVLGAHVSTDPSWVRRFHNEARAASRLDHPNTVRLIDFGQTREGLLFIAMEFLNGRSVRQEIDRLKRIPPARVLRIVAQICASLGEAHNQGIIHRDIKPDNLYLADMKGSGDFIKVLDFSVAKLDTPDAQVTRAGVVFGTPAYMSPEQGRGMPLDARSDIYAVGIVAYEMLNGKPPFDAKIPTEVVMMHLRDTPPPLSGVPPVIAGLVMRALEKDPSRRYQTAEELASACEACAFQLQPQQTPAGLHNVLTPPPEELLTPAGGGPSHMPPPPARATPLQRADAAERTMIADVSSLSGAPPPLASNLPPPPYAAGPQAAPHQATMMADAVNPPSAAPPAAGRTMSLPAASGSTQMLPDSAGVVAFNATRAGHVQRSAFGDTDEFDREPPGVSGLFWVTWAAIGLFAALGRHLWLWHRGA